LNDYSLERESNERFLIRHRTRFVQATLVGTIKYVRGRPILAVEIVSSRPSKETGFAAAAFAVIMFVSHTAHPFGHQNGPIDAFLAVPISLLVLFGYGIWRSRSFRAEARGLERALRTALGSTRTPNAWNQTWT
jgi:hypothetical protein